MPSPDLSGSSSRAWNLAKFFKMSKAKPPIFQVESDDGRYIIDDIETEIAS